MTASSETIIGKQDAFYLTILDSIEEGYGELDRAGNFTYVNKAMTVISGYAQAELLGMNYRHYTTADTERRMYTLFNEIYSTKQSARISDYEMIRKDGNIRIIDISFTPIKDSSGECLGFRGIGRDVTELRRAEKQLRENEDFYRTIVNNTGTATLIVEEDNTISLVNREFEKLSGYRNDEIEGNMRWTDFAPGEVVEPGGENQILPQTVPPPVPDNHEIRFVNSVDDVKNLFLTGVLIPGTRRRLFSLSDITESLQMKEFLEESKERYRTILEEMEDAYFEVDLAGNITFSNDSMGRHLGFTREELLGSSYRLFTLKEDIDTVYQTFHAIYLTGKPVRNFTWEVFRKDGQRGYNEASIFPLRNSTGKIVGFRGVGRDVTERKRSEQALRESEEKYRSILENMEDIYCEMDLQGRCTFVNASACRFSGYGMEELLTMHLRDLTAPTQVDGIVRYTEEIYQTGLPGKPYSWEILKKDGTLAFSEVIVSLIRDTNGRPIGFRGLGRDITERTKAEKALRESEEKYRTILKRMEDGYAELNLAGEFTFVNDAMTTIWGYRKDELLSMNYRAFNTPEEAKKIFKTFNTIFYTGKPASVEDYEIIRKDGHKRIIDMSVSLIRDEGGNPVGFRGVGRDVTDRKRSEALYRIMANTSRAGVYILKNGMFQYTNPTFSGYVGYSPEQTVGLKSLSFVHPDDRHMVRTRAIAMLKGSENLPYEYRIMTKDGRVMWIIETVTSIDYHGTRAVLGNTMDVTDMKAAHRKLREMEALESSMLSSMPHAVFGLKNRSINFANDNVSSVFGWTPAELIGKSIRILYKNDDDYEKAGKRIYTALENEPVFSTEMDIPCIDKEGKEIFCQVNASRIGTVLEDRRIIATYQNITERKAAEEKVRQSLREKEILLQEIHHRVKNNMQVVSSMINLQSRYVKDEKMRELFRDSQNRVRSMALIHENLYRSDDLSSIDFSEYVRSLAARLFSIYRVESNTVTLSVEAEKVFFQIETAIPCGLIINELVSNSLKHAFPAGTGGTITVGVTTDMNANRGCLIVSDTGIGLPNELDIAQSRTLGLQLVTILADQLHGSVEIERRHGTTFKIIFEVLNYGKRF